MQLPVEIIEQILLSADLVSVIRFSSTSKYMRKIVISSKYLWNGLADRDYDINDPKIPKYLVQSGIGLYIRLYETQCIICSKRTTSKDLFYNHVLCKGCQFLSTKYSIITQSAARRKYNVTLAGLATLRTKPKTIQVRGMSRLSVNFYLECDVKDLERRTIVLSSE